MKKILLTALTAIVFSTVAWASEVENYFIVNLKEGSPVEYRFTEKPTMTFNAGNVEITVQTGDKLVLPYGDIKNFTFRHGETGVEAPATGAAAVAVTFDGNTIAVEGVAAGAAIGIYSINGALCAQTAANADGCASIAVADLAPGVYVAAIPGHNFKFIKK